VIAGPVPAGQSPTRQVYSYPRMIVKSSSRKRRLAHAMAGPTGATLASAHTGGEFVAARNDARKAGLCGKNRPGSPHDAELGGGDDVLQLPQHLLMRECQATQGLVLGAGQALTCLGQILRVFLDRLRPEFLGGFQRAKEHKAADPVLGCPCRPQGIVPCTPCRP
jgi:hypothetical protein